MAVTKNRIGAGEIDFIFNPKIFDGENSNENIRDNKKTPALAQAGEHNSLHKRSRNSAASAFKAGGAGGSGRDCKGKRQRSGKADSPQSEACGLHS